MKPFITELMNDFGKASQQQLTNDLTQAFYRQEYETVDLLASKGAQFTDEMLQVAVKMKDPQLVLRCLHAGVTVPEGMRRDVKDEALKKMFDRNIPHVG